MSKWDSYVDQITKLREQLMKYDKENLYTYPPHNLGADDKDIENVERFLGYQLDEGYREFLKVSNGLRFYFQELTLFSTKDLTSETELHTRGDELLEDILEYIEYDKRELLPISVDEENIDLFVLVVNGKDKGNVIWYAGYEVEHYNTFEEYIVDTIKLLTRSLEKVK